ncbi:FecR family protein [Phenylobacterium sp.]|uniref:FecR family protein n=1 Tax=Phenylobacterium sp. TaxID=1871053 RepID=UPI002CDF5EA4|nr:FecR domain-containing protein [Phenylobacterium sp.]HVI33846.1 FecR domain-containing protein [Phenylobacterium sp.]
MNQPWAYGGDAARSEAADWIVRLQADDLAESEALAFDAWLEASPEHVRAYDAALAVWGEFDSAGPDVDRALRADRVRPQHSRRFYLAAGALAAAAAVAVVVLPGRLTEDRPLGYTTVVGEHRTVSLADGSTIDLNAGTRLSVVLGRHERRVVLDEGQAVFDVAADARRPFVIDAGDRTVRVVGTRFDVRRRDGRLSVTVAEGLVEVRPTPQAGGRAFRLRPGQRLDHVEGSPQARVIAAAPEEVLGWRSGRLVYRDRPLGEVVADLNEQFPTPIRIEDPSLAATPISGVLIVDDQDAVIRRLALLVPVSAVRSGDSVILRRDDARR